MREDDPNAKSFPVTATWDNTFIVGTSDNRVVIAKRELAKLNAENETVIITDPYLFNGRNDTQYHSDLLDILLSLKAESILYCAPSIQDQAMFCDVVNKLDNAGCDFVHDCSLTDCHDRFWLCVNQKKAVVFGTSLNGLCKRICRVDSLSEDEVSELIQELKSRNIIEE